MKEQKHILVVEDDLNLGFLIVELLESEGYFVKLCKDGQMGLNAVNRENFDLCILDVMMPKLDGFSLAKRIKSVDPELPFLFLTAKSRKTDQMEGYACGAEDYILKPFDEDVLLCKIRVILRRYSEEQPIPYIEEVRLGNYTFDYQLQLLKMKDVERRLTEKENEVLYLLCQNKNKILRRDEAVEKIYGRKDYFLGRSFDVFISRLRKIFQDEPEVSIENVYKVGFILKVAD